MILLAWENWVQEQVILSLSNIIHDSPHNHERWKQLPGLASTLSISSRFNGRSNCMPFWIAEFLGTVQGKFFSPYTWNTRHLGREKFRSSGVQGAKTALGGVDVFVSAAVCSAHVGCFASFVCEVCSPSTAHPHGLFPPLTLLCWAASMWPLCIPWVIVIAMARLQIGLLVLGYKGKSWIFTV